MKMASTAATQLLGPNLTGFVEATEPTSANEDFIFGQMEDFSGSLTLDTVDEHHVNALLKGAQHIRSNSGVGSPEVAKYVDTQAPSLQRNAPKASSLRSLAEQLYVRRPVLYLKGHAEALPATVLLRSARKPSVGALSTAGAAAGLFKSPDNSFIVIKFDPQFGYADIIVDPFFTDAFIQQPSTPTYSALLAALPRAFVGTAAELHKMVALLTAESMKAYAEKGVSSPPWRRFDAMVARWQPKLYNDEVITHGPGGAPQRPAAAALNPSLFAAVAAAPAADSKLPVQRGNSTTSTMSTDSSSSSSDYAGSESPRVVQSEDFSYSSNSSSSTSTHGDLSSTTDHTVIYGFEVPSKQQQQLPTASDSAVLGGNNLAPLPTADVSTAAVAAKLAQALGDTAAATAAPEYSIKAVYPATAAAELPATPVTRPIALMQQFAVATTADKQQQKPPLDSMTAQVLAANGYGKPRVIKPIGSGTGASGGGPVTAADTGGDFAAAAGLPATAADAGANQRVCHGYLRSSSLNFNIGMKCDVRAFPLPGAHKTAACGTADPDSLAAVRDQGAVCANTLRPEPGRLMCSSRVVDTADRWVQHVGHKSVEVKGLAAVVAEYKDTVLRVPIGVTPGREMQVTRVVAGRRIVRLCSSPGRVIKGFGREGARAA